MIEQGEMRPKPLAQITSLDDVREGRLRAAVDASGVVRIRQGAREVKAPRNEAVLRRRSKLRGFSFIFARFRHSDR
eukprot:2822741-Alexandrium_andersonii.AAC.1